jgi:hypothetical protein
MPFFFIMYSAALARSLTQQITTSYSVSTCRISRCYGVVYRYG